MLTPARQHRLSLPFRKLESDPLHEPRIGHFLPFPAFDRRDKTRDRRTLQGRDASLKLHLEEGFIEDESQRGATCLRYQPREDY